MSTAPVGRKLSRPPEKYDPRDQMQTRETIENEISRCLKRDEEVQPVRLVLADTVTGTRYKITIASGVLTLTAL